MTLPSVKLWQALLGYVCRKRCQCRRTTSHLCGGKWRNDDRARGQTFCSSTRVHQQGFPFFAMHSFPPGASEGSDGDSLLRPTRPAGRQPSRPLKRLSVAGLPVSQHELLQSPIRHAFLTEPTLPSSLKHEHAPVLITPCRPPAPGMNDLKDDPATVS